ncbi:MAG TPA: ABC transporter permease [Nitrososphaera sp.]|nr:ABC transporter permease [Nitrososphaera sp.]
MQSEEIQELPDSTAQKGKGRGGSLDVSDVANIAIFLAAFVGIWQLVYIIGIYPSSVLPSPADAATTLLELASTSLFVGIGTSMLRLAVGFAISVALGGLVGLAMVKFRGFGKTISSFAVGLLTFPSIAWVPFAIVLIGFSDFGILFVVIMASVWSVMITTYSSLRNIPPIYVRAAKNMGASGFTLFRHVMIPAATPALIVGMRQAWSIAWHALIGAEMLITTLAGLGYILSVGREFNLMNQIIAVMITIFAIGIVVDRVLFVKLEEKAREKWGLTQQR